jgi:hypothetical protein
MAIFQQFIISLSLAVHLAGCENSSSTRSRDSASAAQVSNSMPDLWTTVRNEIDTLERTGAPLSKWKEASVSNERISTILRLHEMTKPLKSESELEMSELEKLFSNAPDTFHFGFEGNFQSLVFFDASAQPIRVVKW